MYQTPYSFYLLIHDRTSQQSLEDTSKEHGTFSTIPSFLFVLQELLAHNKVRSCWGVWEVFFYVRFFLTGDVQVNESIKEQVHLKIPERKHSPHKQTGRNQRSAMHKLLQAVAPLSRGGRWLICCFMFSL